MVQINDDSSQDHGGGGGGDPGDGEISDEEMELELSRPRAEPTSWMLESLELENFKSYKDRVTIGPFRPFVSIIGPNGSGKSNLMDAISFVMGEKTSCLRVRRLNELIHGASVGTPVATQARVTAIFKKKRVEDDDDEGESEKRFTRCIRGSSSEYSINGQAVNQANYFEGLKALGINVKGKNFLVFQGSIENIAMKNSKELTTLLEQICGSGALKEEYELRKAEMTEADRRIEGAFMKQKGTKAERREIQLEVKEADKYHEYCKTMAEKETELYLFQFFHLNEELETIKTKLEEKMAEAEKKKEDKDRLEEEWKQKKKARSELNILQSSKEAILQNLMPATSELTMQLMEAQQKLKHQQTKISAAKKSLKNAEESKKSIEEDISENTRRLKRAEADEQSFLNQSDVSQFSPPGDVDLDVTLRDSQINEYWELKKQVIEETQKEKKEIEELEARLKDKEDVFNSLTREKTKIEAQLELKSNEAKENKKLINKVSEKLEEFQEQLSQLEQGEIQPLRFEVSNAEANVDQLQHQLEDLTIEIESAKSSRYEEKTRKRKLETLTSLQKHFSGVMGRITDLCKPRHGKYNIAFTKLMGKHLDAIVVDTEQTARQCIRYLREQMIEQETFLPLNQLEVKPLKYQLRNQVEGVHLAYDLLQFKKEIEKAILHCVKSQVICRTRNEARQAAYGELFREPVSAVSEDGTLYSVSGIISGGVADLQRKARRWNDNDLQEKEQQRQRMKDELMQSVRTTRKKVKLEGLEQELAGLQKRLQYVKEDHSKRVKLDADLEKEKASLEKELKSVTVRWKEAEKALSAAGRNLRNIEAKMNIVEDRIFSDFCSEINIRNIREYEERDVRAHEELTRKRGEFREAIQNLKDRIVCDTEQKESFEKNVNKWKEVISQVQKCLSECEVEQKRCKDALKKEETSVTTAQNEVNEIKKSIELMTKEVSTAHKNLNRLDKALLSVEKEINFLRASKDQKTLERHELFNECKFNGIEVPLIQASLEDIEFGESSNRTLQEILEEEEGIPIQFDGLNRQFKNLRGTAVKEKESEIKQELQELTNRINQFQVLHLKADQKLEAVKNRAREQQLEFDEFRKDAKTKKAAFEKVKKRRLTTFMHCFEVISKNIDQIYKALTRSSSAQASLDLENMEEPYLSGMNYHCVAPGKRFQPMSNLSGGEKTLAALAFLFAIHSCEPAPFFVLDEIDAALDNKNIEKVTSYIREKAEQLQFLVISLKEEFYGMADALVGIAPDIRPSECVSSKAYTLDLQNYEED